MNAPAAIRFEVAWGTTAAQRLKAYRAEAGATVGQVVARADVRADFPELAAAPQPRLGVWGRACDAARVLRDNDRIEIYRPLLVDPKDARRTRAARR